MEYDVPRVMKWRVGMESLDGVVGMESWNGNIKWSREVESWNVVLKWGLWVESWNKI